MKMQNSCKGSKQKAGEKMGEVIVSMKDIVKTFPGVKALDHVNFELRSGEVMALLGENGAGKSTLMKILSGVYTKDSGTMTIFGTEYENLTPKQAQAVGVAIIHQELNMCRHLSVAENMFLGREKVNGIVVHYTANPGTTAQQNRDYFEGLAQSGETHASSHFVIGISGEIIQCIPCNEIAYASNERNADTISIECCIPDDTGKFTDATYGSLVHLVTWLMGRYDLTTDDVIRHYDVTGKACPKYYVENEAAWEQFKSDLVDYIETNGIAKTEEIQ